MKTGRERNKHVAKWIAKGPAQENPRANTREQWEIKWYGQVQPVKNVSNSITYKNCIFLLTTMSQLSDIGVLAFYL